MLFCTFTVEPEPIYSEMMNILILERGKYGHISKRSSTSPCGEYDLTAKKNTAIVLCSTSFPSSMGPEVSI